jgi:hypothetical protein
MLMRSWHTGATLALLLLWGGVARAEAPRSRVDGERWQQRGLMRAGMSLVTAGISSSLSSVALLATTAGRQREAAVGMAAAGAAMRTVGGAMWSAGAPGRRTRPGRPAMLYTGLLLAGAGLAALPVSSGLVAASFDEGTAEPATLRIAAAIVAGSSHALVAVGIPLWAKGAASPDDPRAALQLGAAALALAAPNRRGAAALALAAPNRRGAAALALAAPNRRGAAATVAAPGRSAVGVSAVAPAGWARAVVWPRSSVGPEREPSHAFSSSRMAEALG